MKRLVPTVAACAMLWACTNHDYYGQANVSVQDGDPSAILDVNAGVWIAEGAAASAHIDLVGVGGTDYAGDVASKNPSVLSILHTPSDPGKYVFLGVSPGTAEIVISVNGVPVRSCTGTVEAPVEDAGSDAGAPSEAGDDEAGGDEDAGDAASEPDAIDASDTD